jgi:hypothetical protein
MVQFDPRYSAIPGSSTPNCTTTARRATATPSSRFSFMQNVRDKVATVSLNLASGERTLIVREAERFVADSRPSELTVRRPVAAWLLLATCAKDLATVARQCWNTLAHSSLLRGCGPPQGMQICLRPPGDETGGSKSMTQTYLGVANRRAQDSALQVMVGGPPGRRRG